MATELEKIIAGCKANDHKAFEIVYKKYYRVLLGISMRYSSTSAEAEDVLQDAFIKIFNNIGAYSEKGSFEGWLKRIVQNTAINQYRKNMRFVLSVESYQEEEEQKTDLDSIFQNFDTKHILQLLNQLPPGYRLIINLYCIDGYSHKEISGMLNITTGTSKSQLFKARNFLKELIESYNKQVI
jgi:RNA polymerase sigma factor (sigma-70 family)